MKFGAKVAIIVACQSHSRYLEIYEKTERKESLEYYDVKLY